MKHVVPALYLSLSLLLGAQSDALAQAPETSTTVNDREWSIELGFLGAAVSYAQASGSGGSLLGIAVGGGAQLGLSVPSGEAISGGFFEFAHVAAFVRLPVSASTQIDFGPRVAWIYNFTEIETRFFGAYVAGFTGGEHLKMGARVLAGVHVSENYGNTTTVSLEPFILAMRW